MTYQEFLLQELELKGAWTLNRELPVGYLNRFLGPPSILCRVQCLNGYHYRVVVISQSGQVVVPVECRVDHADLRGELLLEAGGELVGVRMRQIRIRVEAINVIEITRLVIL